MVLSHLVGFGMMRSARHTRVRGAESYDRMQLGLLVVPGRLSKPRGRLTMNWFFLQRAGILLTARLHQGHAVRLIAADHLGDALGVSESGSTEVVSGSSQMATGVD